MHMQAQCDGRKYAKNQANTLDREFRVVRSMRIITCSRIVCTIKRNSTAFAFHATIHEIQQQESLFLSRRQKHIITSITILLLDAFLFHQFASASDSIRSPVFFLCEYFAEQRSTNINSR